MTDPTPRERDIRHLLYNMTGPSSDYAAWVSLRDDAKFLLGLLDEARAEKKAAVAVERVRPIPMILYCPHCGLQHVDAPERERGWTNPPHKSHLCAECGKVWRPADVFTVGVPNIETMGKADAYNPLRAGDERVAAERARCAKIARRHGKPVPERPHDRIAIADNIAEAIERGGE